MREELERLLREAGEILRSAQDADKHISAKEGPANFVTAYDVAVQNKIRERLLALRPDAQFIGEEAGAQGDVRHGTAFIVDPIDGTTNFIKGCDASAISIAMLEEGRPVLGAVYDPYRDEFYYAEKGRGATRNGRPIQVSEEDLAHSVVCLGTAPYYPELQKQTFAIAAGVLEEALDLHRSGSSVIDLCQTARGSVGLMFELLLCPWDHAAAGFILTEAGGVITQLDGSPVVYDRKCSVVAGCPKAHGDFFRLGLHQRS